MNNGTIMSSAETQLEEPVTVTAREWNALHAYKIASERLADTVSRLEGDNAFLRRQVIDQAIEMKQLADDLQESELRTHRLDFDNNALMKANTSLHRQLAAAKAAKKLPRPGKGDEVKAADATGPRLTDILTALPPGGSVTFHAPRKGE